VNLVATIEDLEVNGAKGAVILEGLGTVDQGVLDSELFFEIGTGAKRILRWR
jgi:hypothetical protein